MVILRSQNKITDFLMILASACPFNFSEIKESYINVNFPRILSFSVMDPDRECGETI